MSMIISVLKDNSVSFKEHEKDYYEASYSNGYGVDVRRNEKTEDKWDISVMKGGEYTCDSDITKDFEERYLNNVETIEIIQAVKRLDKNGKLPEGDPFFEVRELI